MGNFVKEAFQVDGGAPLLPFLDMLPDIPNGLVLALSFPKPEVPRREVRIEYLFQNQVDALSGDTVHDHGDAQLSLLG